MNLSLNDRMETSWRDVLADEFAAPYMAKLEEFVAGELAAGKNVYPPIEQVFNAFTHTPYDKVKVLLLGQDPYHGDGQAHGLSFSVPPGVATPPSLRNMYKELAEDIGCAIPGHGNLTAWADQGVMLLNAVLTVRANEAASHKGQGWEAFTDAVITKLSAREKPLVFLLWGGFAKKKTKLIDTTRHTVIESAHPSPLSMKGFFGTRPYSKVNTALEAAGESPIKWEIPDA